MTEHSTVVLIWIAMLLACALFWGAVLAVVFERW